MSLRKQKDKAFVEPGSAAAGVGHNQNDIDCADKACVKRVAELEMKRAVLAGEIKDILTEHKNSYGTPKGSIRIAVKTLDMSEEQYQAKKSVQDHAEHILELFAEEDGQLSFLRKNKAEAA